MKILIDGHMIHHKLTGIGRYHKNLIQELSNKENVELSIYLDTAKNILLNSSHQKYYGLFKNGLYRILVGFNTAMLKLKPDILHVNFFTPIISGIKGTCIVTNIYDLCFEFYPQTYSRKMFFVFNTFLKRSINNSDAIICTSNTTKKTLIKIYDVNPNKVFVIYLAANSSFKSIPDKKNVKKYLKNKFKIENEYFLVVGDLNKRKNPIQIIEAFLKLAKNRVNIELVFAGSNKIGNVIEERFINSISSGKLKILDYVSDKDLNILYNGAEALVFNSLCEGFGLPIVEAMACKTPVICSDINVFHEIASKAAIFVEDKNELYNAMERIIKNKKLRDNLGEKGYERSKNFSWEKTARETLEVYNWVLKKKKI